MNHLFDTCTIKNRLRDGSTILSVSEYCYKTSEPFIISSEIQIELKPPERLDSAVFEIAKKTASAVEFCIKLGYIQLIDIESDNIMADNYRKIRRRYYGWMTKSDYCKKLIKDGILTEEEYKSRGFRYRDAGECTLIAIAMTDPENFTIISEDNGKVYMHPLENIFDTYRELGIIVVKYKNWVNCNKIPNADILPPA